MAMFEREELEALPRKALQALCKERKIKANSKTAVLVEDLLSWAREAGLDESEHDAGQGEAMGLEHQADEAVKADEAISPELEEEQMVEKEDISEIAAAPGSEEEDEEEEDCQRNLSIVFENVESMMEDELPLPVSAKAATKADTETFTASLPMSEKEADTQMELQKQDMTSASPTVGYCVVHGTCSTQQHFPLSLVGGRILLEGHPFQLTPLASAPAGHADNHVCAECVAANASNSRRSTMTLTSTRFQSKLPVIASVPRLTSAIPRVDNAKTMKQKPKHAKLHKASAEPAKAQTQTQTSAQTQPMTSSALPDKENRTQFKMTSALDKQTKKSKNTTSARASTSLSSSRYGKAKTETMKKTGRATTMKKGKAGLNTKANGTCLKLSDPLALTSAAKLSAMVKGCPSSPAVRKARGEIIAPNSLRKQKKTRTPLIQVRENSEYAQRVEQLLKLGNDEATLELATRPSQRVQHSPPPLLG